MFTCTRTFVRVDKNERAARLLCLKRGVNPDALDVTGKPHWVAASRSIAEWLAIQEVIEEVAEEEIEAAERDFRESETPGGGK